MGGDEPAGWDPLKIWTYGWTAFGLGMCLFALIVYLDVVQNASALAALLVGLVALGLGLRGWWVLSHRSSPHERPDHASSASDGSG